MRQVPALDAVPIDIVGDGRVARHFLHYLNLLGFSVRAWSRRAPAAGPTEALASCRTVLLLIRDAGASRALSGPLSRGDAETISANLKALERDPFHAVYCEVARAYELRS